MNQFDEMTNLAQKECIPCKTSTPPLKGSALLDYLEQLRGEWRVVEEHHLEKQFNFSDFKEALEFTNRVGELAEAQNHHPDIYLSWGKVKLVLWTHKIEGLSESDFVFAAKVDQLPRKASS